MDSSSTIQRMLVAALVVAIVSVSVAFVAHVDGVTGARGDEVAALGTVPCCD